MRKTKMSINLTKENMINELNEYGYNEETLYNIMNMFYEIDGVKHTVDSIYQTLKNNKVSLAWFKGMVNEYYLTYGN